MTDHRTPVAIPLPAERVRLTECEGGPVLVRGAQVVVDAHGVTHPVTRPVVALCRCGSSQRLPWCDGVHKRLGTGQRPSSPERSFVVREQVPAAREGGS